MKNVCELSRKGRNKRQHLETMKRNLSCFKSKGKELAALLCFTGWQLMSARGLRRVMICLMAC